MSKVIGQISRRKSIPTQTIITLSKVKDQEKILKAEKKIPHKLVSHPFENRLSNSIVLGLISHFYCYWNQKLERKQHKKEMAVLAHNLKGSSWSQRYSEKNMGQKIPPEVWIQSSQELKGSYINSMPTFIIYFSQ